LATRINSVKTVYELACRAIEENLRLDQLIATLGPVEPVDLKQARQEKRLLPLIDHLRFNGGSQSIRVDCI